MSLALGHVIELWLNRDESGWRVVNDDVVSGIMGKPEHPLKDDTWRLLTIRIDVPATSDPIVLALRDDLDKVTKMNLTRRINDDMEDPMHAAEEEAARREKVELSFLAQRPGGQYFPPQV